MSYRSIKRMLGETSLERKCRFLFGGGLMLLISVSFWAYAHLNLDIFDAQNRERGRLLVGPRVVARHAELIEAKHPFAPMLKDLGVLQATELSPDAAGAARQYRFELMKSDLASATAGARPSDQLGYTALQVLNEGNETEWVVENEEHGTYDYYGAVFATESCVACHYHKQNAKAGDLIGVAKLSFPLEETRRVLAKNNAVLIAMAIVTAFLAMLAAYAIVRYVIVKPVLHLKDVSDAIAHGDLDQRADIRTGDEFEELSHAFNRMLRHLTTVQDELRDVNTDLDAKVDELARANLSLHEMNKIKNEFLATMSHELRTPLNSILGFSDVLSDAQNLNDKQKKYLSNISTSGRNLLALIDDILDLAKIEAGKMDLHIAEFSVADLIERLELGMRPLAEKKNIDLQSSVDEDLPLAHQDAGKLQQVLYNLMSNAVKFTPEGGRIQVDARLAANDMLELIVADTGIGIPLDDQAAVFEKFRQGRTSLEEGDPLTREYEGTGLGLSIVKELSKLLHGEVTLESEFGRGSAFTVRVPLHLESSLDAIDEALRHQTVEFNRQQAASYGMKTSSNDESRDEPKASVGR